MIWINTFFSAAKNTKKEKIFNQNCSFPLKGLSEIYYLTLHVFRISVPEL